MVSPAYLCVFVLRPFAILLVAFVAKFCGVKAKSPLDGEAVSGLEIRFRGLLRDSDRSSAPAVGGTTTRRTETGLEAAIHDGKSYIDMDAGAKGKIRGRCAAKRRLG